MPRRDCRAGFTLGAVLVTVGILAILASIAVPGYLKAVERGHWRGAQDVLLAIYAGEQVYEAVNDTYVDPAGCVAPPPWQCIYVDNPNGGVVTYAVNATKTTFSVTATRKAGVSMSIDQTKAIDTTAWPQP